MGIEPRKFVICLQNHDQVGNRAFGNRLHHGIEPLAYRAATALLLTAPQTSLLFMGQEWESTSPFLYFTDHDEDLGKIVTEGRRRKFRHFLAFVEPEARYRIPDPQAASTFEASRLDWSERDREPHASTFRLYRTFLALRRSEPVLRTNLAGAHDAVPLDEDTLLVVRWTSQGDPLIVVARLRGSGRVGLGSLTQSWFPREAAWEPVLTTEDPGFAPEPAPLILDGNRDELRIHFSRPGAVIFRRAAPLA